MASSKSTPKSSIRPEQWKMPVSFTVDGRPVTLKDFVDHEGAALSLSALNDDQRAELAAERIQQQPRFELGMIGAGVVDKASAIAEVRAKSPVGRTLIEIETRTVQSLVDQARRERA